MTWPSTGEASSLVLPDRPVRPEAAVLVLQGGRAESQDRSRPWHASGLRMRPYVRGLTARLSPAGAVVGRVRYRMRGWNGHAADPVRDTVDALRALEALYGAVPVVLLGHSMGARAALRAAGRPAVRGVVALAPWTPHREPVDQLSGRAVVVLHGDRDRITSPALSREFAARARSAGADTARLVLAGGDHAMLARARDWHVAAAAAVCGMLGVTAYPPLLADALAGLGPGQGLDVPLPAGFGRSGAV